MYEYPQDCITKAQHKAFRKSQRTTKNGRDPIAYALQFENPFMHLSPYTKGWQMEAIMNAVSARGRS